MPEAKRKKMKKWLNTILFFLLVFNAAQAQIGLKQNPLESEFHHFSKSNILSSHSNIYLLSPFLMVNYKINFTQNQSFTSFPKIYDHNHLAFFCKVEVKLEKAAKFPIKLRLGDVDYVNQLEGK